MIAKGVITAADARRAVDAGASAVIVSNHGGRQLDGVPAALVALDEVVAEVGSQVEVLMDGGVRRGSDVAKAIALGAKAVLIGRPWAFGLAAGGEQGAARILEVLRQELDRTLRLLGAASVGDLDRRFVSLPEGWGVRTGP